LKLVHQTKVDHIAAASLYVLVDAGSDEASFCGSITRLCTAGVDVIQLRDRQRDDRTLIHRAKAGTEIARRHGVLFIMNDRADLALAADTDGVHVGQEELPIAVARKILGPNRLIGLSTHSIEQARAATAEGADYIGCGPVFAGRTKTFDDYVGPKFIAQVAREITLPAFAIGGIDLDNVDQVIAAGMRRIAVTGVVRDADDPAATVQNLKSKLGSS
jgi:thiamine-phosphate pyrophosphorylase